MATTNNPQKPTYEELVATIQELQARIVELEAELAKARKNSQTSSKPPSSDMVKPKPKNKKSGRPKKRKQGGQPGHRRHERKAFEVKRGSVGWNVFGPPLPLARNKVDPYLISLSNLLLLTSPRTDHRR